MRIEQAALIYAAVMLPSLGLAIILALLDKRTAAAVILSVCMAAAGISFLVAIALIYIELYHSFF